MAIKLRPPGFTPRYARPSAERLKVAAEHLLFVEECAGLGSLFVATGLIRALVGRGCTVAEAMWIIHDQIEAKRYQRWPLNEIPRDNPNARYFDDELLPGGLIEAPGRLSVDTVDGSGWGGLGVTLPTDSSTPIVGTRQKPLSKQKRGRRPDTDVADDERVFQAWQTGQYLSKAALAKSLGAPWDAKKVIAAVDRHRKRLKCATAKSSSDN